MGKEARIGLTVILVLLIVFGVVLYKRLGGGPGIPSASVALADEATASRESEPREPESKEWFAPATAPKIVAARSGLDEVSNASSEKAPHLGDWPAAGSKGDSLRKEERADWSPPSFMPTPIGATSRSPHPAGVITQTAGAAGPDAPRYADLDQPADVGVGGDPEQSPLQAPSQAPPPAEPFANDISSSAPSYSTYRHPSESLAAPGVYPASGDVYPYRTLSQPIDVGQPLVRDGSYVVQPNDNYWTISQRLYGTGAYFRALAEHNRKRTAEPDQLKPGEKISAPDVAELEKNYRDLCPKAEHRDVARQRVAMVGAASPLGGGRVYVVQEGDTLFDIARFELGRASRWAEIFQLNRTALGDQYDYLTPGMQLVLPVDGPAKRLADRHGAPLRR